MSFIVNPIPRNLSAVYLAQLALKYNVPAIPSGVRPSDVPTLAKYVPPESRGGNPLVVVPAPPPVQIIPPVPPPLPSLRPLIPEPKPEPEPAHSCDTCKQKNSATVQPLTQAVASAPAKPAAQAAPAVPSWLGTALTLGGAFLTSRSIGL